jgi:hypothetical protein
LIAHHAGVRIETHHGVGDAGMPHENNRIAIGLHPPAMTTLLFGRSTAKHASIQGIK